MNHQVLDVQKCLFCENGIGLDFLREVSNFDADKNIRAMITELNGIKLITKTVRGDLMASEAKYHPPCLVKLRNHYRTLTLKAHQSPENIDEKVSSFHRIDGLHREICGLLSLRAV